MSSPPAKRRQPESTRPSANARNPNLIKALNLAGLNKTHKSGGAKKSHKKTKKRTRKGRKSSRK